MTERPERGAGGRRRGGPPRLAHVQRVERVTPHMIRVVLGGPGLEGLEADQYTDHYVKILFPLAGVEYPEPFDMQQIREEMPRELWPSVRTYSVRGWDAAKLELTIDFVYHGDEGIAGPWAARAQPGDPVRFSGPGGGYAPDPDADWHLLAGDESALPAIAAALEQMPEGARVHAFIEVSDSTEEQKLETGANATITWLHRGEAPAGKTLVEAVSGFEFPEGAVHAFVHGEASTVRAVRRHLLVERGVPREALSASGYWKRTRTEEGWREDKAEWNRQAEEDVAAQ
jgi:NADPH-dependent ferric siderophore reductase